MRGMEYKERLFLLIVLLALVAVLSDFVYSAGPGPNYRNYSIDTRVNLTGSPPVILPVCSPRSDTMNGGSLANMPCNASIRDYKGGSEVYRVNASLRTSPGVDQTADNN